MAKANQELDSLNSSLFEKLLTCLHPIRATANKEYDDIYLKLAFFFERNNCDPDKAFETLVIVAKRIDQDGILRDQNRMEVLDKRSFIFGIAKKLKLESLRSAAKLSDELPPEHAVPEGLRVLPESVENENKEDELFFETSKKMSIQMFGQRHREQLVLLSKYFIEQNSTEDHEKMASEQGTTVENLRVQVCRSKATFWFEHKRNLKGFQKKFGY